MRADAGERQPALRTESLRRAALRAAIHAAGGGALGVVAALAVKAVTGAPTPLLHPLFLGVGAGLVSFPVSLVELRSAELRPCNF